MKKGLVAALAGAAALIGAVASAVQIYDRFKSPPTPESPCYIGSWRLTSETAEHVGDIKPDLWLMESGTFTLYLYGNGEGRITMDDWRKRKTAGAVSLASPTATTSAAPSDEPAVEEFTSNGSLTFKYSVVGAELHYVYSESEKYTATHYKNGAVTDSAELPATDFSAADTFECSDKDHLQLHDTFASNGGGTIDYVQSFVRI